VTQHSRGGYRRVWTFQFGEDDTVTVDRRDDDRFARALAGRLGWAAPDSDPDPDGCGRFGARSGHKPAPEAEIRDEQWARQDSNLDLTDYESAALTD
jgi:hypothetical protein